MSKSSIELGLLLMWLSCCAVYLAIARTFLLEGPQNVPQVLMLSVLAALHGTCWTGMLIVLWSSSARVVVDVEPGVWLMFSLGIVLSAELIVGALPDDFMIRKESLRIAAACVAFALPTLSRRLAVDWKFVFVALVAISMFPVVFFLRASLTMPARADLLILLAVPMLCIPIVRDYRRGIHRGWLHWIGVACLILWALPRVA